jgi:tRNA(fMet)-specific endonuclease VapC
MELIYGAEKSSAPERNLAVIEGFAGRLDVLSYDMNAASHTGMIRAELAKAGTPIGPYDQMIAGHARSQGLIVVTNNLREFKRVQGLRLEDWTKD